MEWIGFEAMILSDIFEQYPEHRTRLKQQYSSAVVEERTFYPCGFYTKYTVFSKEATLGEGVKLQLGKAQWMLDGLTWGSDYILWIEDGIIVGLEGFSYGEPWPEEIHGCKKINEIVHEHIKEEKR